MIILGDLTDKNVKNRRIEKVIGLFEEEQYNQRLYRKKTYSKHIQINLEITYKKLKNNTTLCSSSSQS